MGGAFDSVMLCWLYLLRTPLLRRPTYALWASIQYYGAKKPDLGHKRLPQINKQSSDFDEIWHTNADLERDYGRMTKYKKNLKILYGGRRIYTNRFLATTRQPIVQRQWNFAQESKMAWRRRSNDENSISKIQGVARPPCCKSLTRSK